MLFLKENINNLSEAEFDFQLSRMPAEKQKEVAAYRKNDDKKRTVCGYMLAVRALAEFLGKNEDEITVAYEESGKPVFDGAFLSIAHAGDFAVCAVSDKKIGIDAETVNKKVSMNVADRICTQNELEYIFGGSAEGDEVKIRLLEIWTKKEALGKMTGEGVLYDMKNTDTMFIKTQCDGELIISVCEE